MDKSTNNKSAIPPSPSLTTFVLPRQTLPLSSHQQNHHYQQQQQQHQHQPQYQQQQEKGSQQTVPAPQGHHYLNITFAQGHISPLVPLLPSGQQTPVQPIVQTTFAGNSFLQPDPPTEERSTLPSPTNTPTLLKAPLPLHGSPTQQDVDMPPTPSFPVAAPPGSFGGHTSAFSPGLSNKRKRATPSTTDTQPQAKKRATSTPLAEETAFEEGSEREAWLVRRLQDPDIYLPLQASRADKAKEKYKSKTAIYRLLAEEFNGKKFPLPSGGFFTVAENGRGVKSKIARLHEGFLRANKERHSTGFGAINSDGWRSMLVDIFKYFFELDIVWGNKWINGAPRLTENVVDAANNFNMNVSRVRKDDGEDDGDESDAGEDASYDEGHEMSQPVEKSLTIDWVTDDEEEAEPLVRRHQGRSVSSATPSPSPSTASSRAGSMRPRRTTPARDSRPSSVHPSSTATESTGRSRQRQKQDLLQKLDMVADASRDISENNVKIKELELEQWREEAVLRRAEIDSRNLDAEVRRIEAAARREEAEARRLEIELRKAEMEHERRVLELRIELTKATKPSFRSPSPGRQATPVHTNSAVSLVVNR